MTRSRVRRRVAALVVFLVAMTGTLVGSSTANAAGTCDDAKEGARFDGYYHQSNIFLQYNFEGASAYIRTQNGVLCTGTQYFHFTSAYVMIASDVTAPVGWAQVGFDRSTQDDYLHWFAQAYDGKGDIGTIDTYDGNYSIGAGAIHGFYVLWSPNCNCERMTIDNSMVLESTFDPKNRSQSAWVEPFSPQFSGETYFAASDVPGVPSLQTQYSALGAQQVVDNHLISMPCTMKEQNDVPTRWGLNHSSCTAFNIWTQTP